MKQYGPELEHLPIQESATATVAFYAMVANLFTFRERMNFRMTAHEMRK